MSRDELLQTFNNVNFIDHKKLIGIYFLIRDGNLIYVGQSINVAARIVSHEIDFDEVFYIPFNVEELNIIESAILNNISGLLNKRRSANKRRRGTAGKEFNVWIKPAFSKAELQTKYKTLLK